jgi:hypothetical protein
MKSVLLLMSVLFSFSSQANDIVMCADEIASYDQEKCTLLISKYSFEVIPVELCQFRMSSGEMLECYEAIKDKSYKYEDILSCAATQRLGIPGCLESVGVNNTSND